MVNTWNRSSLALLLFGLAGFCNPSILTAQTRQKPNILVIMGDDIGWFNIGAYHRGMMAGRTPNLDRLAAQGLMFTDTTPRRVAPPDAPISLPVNCRYGPG
jgi:hypothetical protein